MKKDRLDMLCDAIFWALLKTDDFQIIEELETYLDFIYNLFPEQKVTYEGQLEDIDSIDSNRGIEEQKNQDCQ